MTRGPRHVVLAATLAVTIGGCGATGSYAPAAVSTDRVDAAGLADLLPTEKAMEELLALPLDVESKAQGGSGRIAYYRPSTGDKGRAGGYVTLALFDTEAAAATSLKGNINYKRDRKVAREKGVLTVFTLTDLADAGNGLVYREPGEPPSRHTIGIARIGRLVLEVVLFHGPGEDRVAAVRQVVERLRGRLPRQSRSD
jgi:hypothetical protein